MNFLFFPFQKQPYRRHVPNLHLIIFSKDRACQLDSLLRSLKDHFHYAFTTLTILYRSSDTHFQMAYDTVRGFCTYPDSRWVQEENFASDLRKTVADLPDDELVMFLVDDDITIRPVNPDRLLTDFTNDYLFLSFRASRDYLGYDQRLPEFLKIDPYLAWNWRYYQRKNNTWNYPFSVDGNIFHIWRIQKILKEVSFKAPNSLESAMHDYRKKRWIKAIPLAMATPCPIIFNNPLNRVQTENETWHKNIDPSHINDMFLSGKRINNAMLYGATSTSTHPDMGLHWEDRPQTATALLI